MSHTPGPWKVSELDWRAVEGPDDLVVADVVNWRDTDDARLIAAAPDLLEALKTLAAEEWRDDGDVILQAARRKAREAIAKAEGK